MMALDTWAEDTMGWDRDTGNPGIMLFANAVQVWAVMQDKRPITVGDAAAAFNAETRRVAEAVREHPWMFLEGPDDDPARQTIEHEGE